MLRGLRPLRERPLRRGLWWLAWLRRGRRWGRSAGAGACGDAGAVAAGAAAGAALRESPFYRRGRHWCGRLGSTIRARRSRCAGAEGFALSSCARLRRARSNMTCGGCAEAVAHHRIEVGEFSISQLALLMSNWL